MADELTVHTEVLGDIPLLLGIIRELKIAEAIDASVPMDGHWAGISVGTLASVWLCYLLSTQDHRLVAVREWVMARQETFNRLLGVTLRDTDCSDDRLAIMLTQLGQVTLQNAIDDR